MAFEVRDGMYFEEDRNTILSIGTLSFLPRATVGWVSGKFTSLASPFVESGSLGLGGEN